MRYLTCTPRVLGRLNNVVPIFTICRDLSERLKRRWPFISRDFTINWSCTRFTTSASLGTNIIHSTSQCFSLHTWSCKYQFLAKWLYSLLRTVIGQAVLDIPSLKEPSKSYFREWQENCSWWAYLHITWFSIEKKRKCVCERLVKGAVTRLAPRRDSEQEKQFTTCPYPKAYFLRIVKLGSESRELWIMSIPWGFEQGGSTRGAGDGERWVARSDTWLAEFQLGPPTLSPSIYWMVNLSPCEHVQFRQGRQVGL